MPATVRTNLITQVAVILILMLLGAAGLAKTGLVFFDNLAISVPLSMAILLGCHAIAQALNRRE